MTMETPKKRQATHKQNLHVKTQVGFIGPDYIKKNKQINKNRLKLLTI
ncbi:hypothetical protein ACQWG3_24740 [Salmonella enterica subsp. enterica serovar Infantis]